MFEVIQTIADVLFVLFSVIFILIWRLAERKIHHLAREWFVAMNIYVGFWGICVLILNLAWFAGFADIRSALATFLGSFILIGVAPFLAGVFKETPDSTTA